MKLNDLLKVIAFDNYSVVLQDVNFFDVTRVIYDYKSDGMDRSALKDYLEHIVLSLDENHVITIKTFKL